MGKEEWKEGKGTFFLKKKGRSTNQSILCLIIVLCLSSGLLLLLLNSEIEVKRSSVGVGGGMEDDGEEKGVSLEDLRKKMAEFAWERDWDQFHSPRNLLLALVIIYFPFFLFFLSPLDFGTSFLFPLSIIFNHFFTTPSGPFCPSIL